MNVGPYYFNYSKYADSNESNKIGFKYPTFVGSVYSFADLFQLHLPLPYLK